MANQEEPKPINFRLKEPLYGRLLQLAADDDVSRHEAARSIVKATLQDEHRLELEERLDQLREQVARARHDTAEEVAKLRRDLSTVLEVVLLNLTPATKEQAEEFVREKLKG